MDVEGVRFQLSSEFALSLSLDQIICNKRDLRPVLLETCEKTMRELVRGKKASYYEIYKTSLDQVWNYLKSIPFNRTIQFKIAQASPALSFVQFESLDESVVKVRWQDPAEREFHSSWLGICFRRFERLHNQNFGITNAQIDALYHRIHMSPLPQTTTHEAQLSRLDFRLEEGHHFAFSSDHRELFLKLPATEPDLDYIRKSINRAARGLCLEHAASYAHFCRHELHEFRQRILYGELATDPTHFETVLVCNLRHDTADESKTLSQPTLNASSPGLFDPFSAPICRHIAELMKRCSLHLHQTSSEERFFSHSAFTYDAQRNRDLFHYATQTFGQLQPSTESDASEFIVALQILPVLISDRQFQSPPCKSSHRQLWLKSVLREAANIGVLSKDFHGLIRSFLIEVDVMDLERATDELVRAGLLRFDEALGRYEARSSLVQTEEEVRGETIFRYYDSVFSLTTDMTHQLPPGKFFWAWKSVRCLPSRLEDLRDFCNSTTKGLLELETKCPDRNTVFQACLQVIPA